MRKRDELSDPNSCMSKARDDEWTFVLLGRDVAAPVAVRAWIEERIRAGKNTRDDAQIVEAEAWINAQPAARMTPSNPPSRAGEAEQDMLAELRRRVLKVSAKYKSDKPVSSVVVFGIVLQMIADLAAARRALPPPGEGKPVACDHPWHNNPALIFPCPSCGAGDDETAAATHDGRIWRVVHSISFSGLKHIRAIKISDGVAMNKTYEQATLDADAITACVGLLAIFAKHADQLAAFGSELAANDKDPMKDTMKRVGDSVLVNAAAVLKRNRERIDQVFQDFGDYFNNCDACTPSMEKISEPIYALLKKRRDADSPEQGTDAASPSSTTDGNGGRR